MLIISLHDYSYFISLENVCIDIISFFLSYQKFLQHTPKYCHNESKITQTTANQSGNRHIVMPPNGHIKHAHRCQSKKLLRLAAKFKVQSLSKIPIAGIIVSLKHHGTCHIAQSQPIFAVGNPNHTIEFFGQFCGNGRNTSWKESADECRITGQHIQCRE